MNSAYIMMLISALVVLVNSSSALPNTHWLNFKSNYGKTYDNHHEESMRSVIFARNKQMIDQFNLKHSKLAGYRMGLNHLSDRTESELKQINGFKMAKEHESLMQNSQKARQFIDNILTDSSINVPGEIDWRKVPGRVTPVKNQGLYCGSCWAFATTGVLEGQEIVRKLNISSIKKGLIALSESNLVDCSTDNNGCHGGSMEYALEFVSKEGGIDDEQSYPYKPEQQQCSFNKSNVAYIDSGAAVLDSGDEEQLKQFVAKFGPVAVAIDASHPSFHYYESGVYFEELCNQVDLDHAVLIVGYGTDPEKGDFWIVKNSWAKTWGENGYVRMARNKNNHCGIATRATIPTFW